VKGEKGEGRERREEEERRSMVMRNFDTSSEPTGVGDGRKLKFVSECRSHFREGGGRRT
jgi:hypothetical protein